MSENSRTGIYVIIALAALIAAWFARPATVDRSAYDDSGELFFASFDPLEARIMEIVSMNAETGAMRAFKVAQVDGRWSIPSRENYPADAQDRLASAAASVLDLKRGASISDNAADHELFGVIDPTTSNANADGAGTRVTLTDQAGKVLVDVIIGKSVKDSPDIRYVRLPSADRVYTAKVSPDQLSTKFSDWIERDLLKIQGAQVAEIVIDGYSIDEVNNRINPGDRLTLRHESTGDTWTLEDLCEGELLQTEKIEEMRAALDDLEIVDVHRKPAGLSAELKSDGTMKLDNEAVMSLMSRGYFIVNNQLLSNEGDLIVRTHDGVEYTLRFGEVVEFQAGSDTLGDEGESEDEGRGRYVFVTATFNQQLVEAPQYQPVPEPVAAPVPAEGEQEQETDEAKAQREAQEAARNAVISANDAKREDYEKKLADGRDKVKQLNSRFADWYYVVSDATYQKLRLRRTDVVSAEDAEPAKPQAAEDAPVPAFPPPASP